MTTPIFLRVYYFYNISIYEIYRKWRWTFELYFSHCINWWGFIIGYNGTFHSAGSWLLRQQLCGCSPTHPTAERRFRLTSAFNALPSMSSRTVFYCVGLYYTGQCIQSSLDHHSLGLVDRLTWLRSKNLDTPYMRLTGCNARRARPNRHNNIAAHYKKRLLPRSLIRLNNLMKHGSFVGAKHSVHQSPCYC